MLGAVLVAASSANAADKVTLKDGRVFFGTILDESDGGVKILTTVVGIQATVSFRSIEIDTVEHNVPLPLEPSLENPPKPSTPSKQSASAKEKSDFVNPTRYLLIPITGSIGIDGDNLRDRIMPITAEGVQAALAEAVRMKIAHVVFYVDSPGGIKREAERITDILQSFSDDLTYFALVKSSISAAMVVTLACNHIFVTDIGTQGGALSYRPDKYSHNDEVNAKMNSIWAGTLASIAENKNHNPDIARAMVLPEFRLFTWTDSSQIRQTSATPPDIQPSDFQKLDDSDVAVLTLSRNDAVTIGLATAVISRPELIGEHLGIPKWEQHGRFGEARINKAAREIIRAEQKRRKLFGQIKEDFNRLATNHGVVSTAVNNAHSRHPDNYSYTYFIEGGGLTPDSVRAWKQHTDSAIASWHTVLGELRTIKSLTDRMKQNAKRTKSLRRYWVFSDQVTADEVTMENMYDEVIGQLDQLKYIESEANSQIWSLKKNRTKHYR
jgi:CDP-diacylglycerol pyrophosphatase